MIRLKIKTSSKDDLNEYLVHLIDNALNEIADSIGAHIDRTLRDSDYKIGAFDMGLLAREIIVDKSKSFHKEIGTEVPYGQYIEYGTDPHWPPLDPIYDWTWRKRNDIEWVKESGKTITIKGSERSYDTGVLEAARMIVFHISKHGTDPKPFLRPGLAYGESIAKEVLKKHIS